jgi:hypothetical protein
VHLCTTVGFLCEMEGSVIAKSKGQGRVRDQGEPKGIVVIWDSPSNKAQVEGEAN